MQKKHAKTNILEGGLIDPNDCVACITDNNNQVNCKTYKNCEDLNCKSSLSDRIYCCKSFGCDSIFIYNHKY